MSSQVTVAVSDELLIRRIDAALAELIEQRGFPDQLSEAMRYASLGPGKRVRPMLCWRSYVAVGGRDEDDHSARCFRAAAAIEMVHAFSLVHDDLPAMDNDDLRRGRPTVHKRFDEATAVLTGDALQGLAFETLAGLDSTWSAAAVDELARATNDMIAGQVLDTLGAGGGAGDRGASDADRLREVHCLKTGALLRASCRIGGLAGGGSPAQIDRLSAFADALGLMFQAVDDLLDVTSDPATLGKATQKDAEAGKLTYPGVFGIDGTRQEITCLHEQARQALADFGVAADPLRNLADALAIRTR
jgi:geranylgeranyl pyrophosphate synthase